MSLVEGQYEKTYAMKRDWQTVTENRQIQQSVTLALPFLVEEGVARAADLPLLSGVAPPRALSCFKAFVLRFSATC